MQQHIRRQLWISLAVIFGAGLVFFLGTYWFKSQISGVVFDIISQRDLMEQRATLTETLANLRREKQVADNYIRVLDSMVATKDELFLDFSRWLEGEALIYQVGINFNFQGAEVQPTEGSLGYAEFSLRLAGGLHNIVNFLKYLEVDSKRFLMTFNGFDFVKGSDGYNVSTGGRIFFE